MATTITVPSGSGGASVTLTFATAASSALATSLLSAVYSAGSNLFVGTGSTAPSTATGAVNEYLITGSSSQVTVPAGYNIIVDAATGPVTISGNSAPGETVVASNGGFEYFAGSGGGTVDAGGGNVTIVGASNGTGYTTLGDATYTNFFTTGNVSGNNGTTDLQNGGKATISGSNNTLFADTGGVISVTGSANTVVSGSGAATIAASSSGGLFFQVAGTLNFANSGSNTVVAGGAATVAGGTGASLYYAFGTGAFNYTNGGGNDTVGVGGTNPLVVNGGPGGDVTLFTAPGGPASTITAGSGSETINAFNASSNLLFIGSTSSTASTTFITGNAGAETIGAGAGTENFVAYNSTDTFAFKDGLTGGTNVIFNFTSLDTLALSGYGVSAEQSAVANAVVGGGGIVVFLPDKTTVNLFGLTSTSGIHTSLT